MCVRADYFFTGAGAGGGVMTGIVASVHLSVRKGEAGSPAALARFGSAVSCQPKRTATGLLTPSALTMTEFPEISAFASMNFLSSPAIVNQVSACPFADFSPPSAF